MLKAVAGWAAAGVGAGSVSDSSEVSVDDASESDRAGAGVGAAAAGWTALGFLDELADLAMAGESGWAKGGLV